jgi:predicted kinase
MLGLVEDSVATGGSLVVEANFVRGSELEAGFAALPTSVVQVHCRAPLEVLLERYAACERHPGHVDADRIDALRGAVETGRHDPLDLPGETIRLDTGGPIDVEALAPRIAG